MTNQLLQQAMQDAGLEVDELAERVEVDPKTINRWLSGRVPYSRHRARVAQALGVSAHELWPDTEAPLPRPSTAPDGPATDVDAVYPGADDPAAPRWKDLITTATTRIEILDPILGHVPINRANVELLRDRADAGVAVRVLVSDPESMHLLITEHEAGARSSLSQLSRLALLAERAIGYLQALLDHPQVDARIFVAAVPAAVLRVDDQMLVALGRFAAPPIREPILALTHRSNDGLADRYAEHLELIATDTSTPLTPDRDRYPDPDQDPGRYEPSTDFSAPRYGSLGPVARPVTATPSSEPPSRWRRQR